MANVGASATSSAHFAIYNGGERPRQFTVAPGETVTESVDAGAQHDSHYHVTVIGPNRFLRRMTGAAGGAARGLEIVTRFSGAPEKLWFDFVNDSAHAATFTVTPNNYRADGPWNYRVASGATRSEGFNTVVDQHGWYDFTVTCSADLFWTRRVVGHIENGHPSITG